MRSHFSSIFHRAWTGSVAQCEDNNCECDQGIDSSIFFMFRKNSRAGKRNLRIKLDRIGPEKYVPFPALESIPKYFSYQRRPTQKAYSYTYVRNFTSFIRRKIFNIEHTKLLRCATKYAWLQILNK